jgi:hypothetical protein
MRFRSSHLRWLGLMAVLGVTVSRPSPVLAADLKPATLAAYSRYVQATEARVKRELVRPKAFLYIDGLPEARRAEIKRQIQNGEVYMERLNMKDASGQSIDLPDGLIHHWTGDVFVPGATVQQAIELAQDYNHHQGTYPEVERSRLLTHDGNDFHIFYRLRKHKVITVTLNSEHDVRYFQDDAKHWHSVSTATRITQVDDAGKRNEREEPVGHDGGFLWRLDSWWRFEEADGGVYIECESVSLTRDIPTGLGWLIEPFVTSIPKESLHNTLGFTRSALLAKVAPARKQ